MTHCALVGVLSLAAAFTKNETFKPLTVSETPKDMPLEFIKLTDGATIIGGGGGKPAPQKKEEPAPAPAPAPVAPAPTPVVQETAPVPPPVKMEKVPEPPKVEKPVNTAVVNEFKPVEKPKKQAKNKPADKPKDKDDEKSVAKNDAKETKKPEPKKVAVNLNAITRNNDAEVKQQQQLAQARQQREAADAARRANAVRQTALANIGKGLDNLNNSLSDGGGVDITLPPGPGYGQTYMNYAQFVKEIYDRSWIVTDSVTGNEGVVRVEIIVQRNGTARGRILKSSGNSALDRTVQNALNSVSNIGHPFPEGATDNSRTFIINFNLSSKRQAG